MLFTQMACAETPDLGTTVDRPVKLSAVTAFLEGERGIANSAGLLVEGIAVWTGTIPSASL